MPRIDDGKNSEKSLEEAYLADHRFNIAFRFIAGGIYILFGVAIGFIPLLYGVAEGQYSLFLHFDSLTLVTQVFASLFVAVLFAQGLYFMVLGVLKNLDLSEKFSFFGYAIGALVALIFGIALGSLNNMLAMLGGVIIAALNLLLLYIDYRLFANS